MTTNLSEQERKAYEQYLFSSTEEEKQAAIKLLIPGSYRYYHLYFLDLFKKQGSKLGDEDQKTLEKFIKKYQGNPFAEEIQIRMKLLKYDDADSEAQKNAAIDDLRERVLYLSYNFQKPDELERHSDSQSSQNEESDHQGDNLSEEEGFEQEEEEHNEEDEEDQNMDDAFGESELQVSKPKRNQRQQQDRAGSVGSYDDEENNDQQPIKIEEAKQSKTKEKKDKHSFNQKAHFNKQEILKKLKNLTNKTSESSMFLSQLPKGMEQSLDFKKLNPAAVYSYACSKGPFISDLVNESFFETLKIYLGKQKKDFIINQALCNNFTIAQLDKLATVWPKAKEDKTYIGTYFQKHFNEELSEENQETWSLEEKRANLERLYQYAKGRDMPKGLQSTLLLEILEIGIKIGTYDEALFRDYLTMPMVTQEKIFKKEKKAHQDAHWNTYLSNVQEIQRTTNINTSQNSLIVKYLEYFCHQKGGCLESFLEDFDRDYLRSIEVKVQIYDSEDMTNLKVDLKKYQAISQEVILRFLESNKELFKVDEEVQLQVELKNVSTLYAKIFEFNTETYYKKTLSPFNTGVNLDGLVASEEFTFEYKHAPNKKFQEVYKFPTLSGKVGLFIIELIGNGMSARAIIKKGSLSLIHKGGVAGHIAYILNENKEICKGTQTGLYFQNEYYKADPSKNGQIFIPYAKSAVNSKAILMNGGFAQLSDFERATERYEFQAWIHVNPESILVGNQASVLIKPALTINSRKTNVELLKNTKVTLTTTNYIDRVPVTKIYDNITFKNDKEHTLEFQVPPYLESITVLLETEIQNVTHQKTDKFTANEYISISTGQHSNKMTEVFLRKEKKDYYIYVLGKNGEIKSNIPLSLVFANLKYQIQSQKSVKLVTDKQGKIKLGPLKDVIALGCQGNKYVSDQQWVIKADQGLTYPQNIDTIEGEDLEFPVLFSKKSRKQVSLLRLSKDLVLYDLYDQIEFTNKEGSLYNIVKFKNLEAGDYIFQLKGQSKMIQINVHRGTFWENDSFILKNNCLFENSMAQKMVKISSVKVEESKNSVNSDITIKLEDFSEGTRVHCIANQFIQQSEQRLYFGLRKLIKEKFSSVSFPFAMWKNIFLSNRELGDEFRYVFDRKYAERLMGSSLDKPKLVLRRNFLQNTQINQEMLNQGSTYTAAQVYEVQQKPQAKLNQRSQPQMQMQSIARNCQMKASYDDCDFAGGFGGGGYDRDIAKEMENKFIETFAIKEFQNFLKQSPNIQYNLIPDSNGEVKFSANLAPYTQLQVYVVSNNSVAQATQELEVHPIQKRDLSLSTPLDTNKGFTECRTTTILKKDETHQIEDITSTEIQIVDDLNKAKQVLEELQRQRGSYSNNFKDLASLTKWLTIDEEEKNNQYARNACHELNIFIYFKDPQYFQKIVKPYQQNKMEKTFIDYYILEDYDQLIKFKDIQYHSKINALEQCFLIDALIKRGLVAEAKKVLAWMIMNHQVQKGDMRSENRVFDIVMNMNSLKTEVGQEALTSAMKISAAKKEMEFRSSIPSSSSAAAPRLLARQNSEIRYNNAYDSCQDDEDLDEEDYYGGEQECEEVYRPQKYESKKEQVNYREDKKRKRAPLFEDDYANNIQQAIKKRKVNVEELDDTKEYNETHYFKQNSYLESASRITLNAFYIDYATYLLESADKVNEQHSFLSSNFYSAEASAFAVLSLLALPLTATPHKFITNEGRGVDIHASGSLILFKKEIKETELDIKNDIMITHRYIQVDNTNPSYDQDGNEIDKVQQSGEFLINNAYLCEVIITNVSPQNKEFSILYQIPQGSVPLQVTKYMKSLPQTLAPYTTDKVKFHFYFPAEGTFVHFPTNIAINYKVVARAGINTFKAVKNHTVLKKETFKDILIGGVKQDVLEFLKTHNLVKGERGFTFEAMLWMLKDQAFFTEVIEILRSRLIYNNNVWSYALLHKNDEKAIVEYLDRERPSYIYQKVGTLFNSKLVTVGRDNTEFKHLDYFPMVNARVHSIGDSIQQWSLNKNFKETYERFLKAMLEQKSLSLQDKMTFIYNFNLQDRSTEAIQLFKTLDLKEGLSTTADYQTLQIQYDYMMAYFDFFIGADDGFKVARSIVRKYEDYPVISWRVMFLQMLDQLNEYDGDVDSSSLGDSSTTENQTEEQKKLVIKKLVKKEPNLSVEVVADKQKLVLESYNINSVTVKFYIIDVEILFSRTPFLKENTEEFSYVKPCHTVEHEILKESATETQMQNLQTTEILVPEKLKNANMVVEIFGAGKQIFKTYYSSQLKVTVIESFGELKVTDVNNKPVPKVYVKVFQQKVGQSTTQAMFFKDGYTDIRGKFEYSQTSGTKVKSVQRFAILVTSDTLGSVIKECQPPKTDDPTDAPTVNAGLDQQWNAAKFNHYMGAASKSKVSRK